MFANCFYLPKSVKDSYDFSAKWIHIPVKDVRALLVEVNGKFKIRIKIIVSPIISLYSDFEDQGAIKSQEDGLNRLEYIQTDLGIYYSLVGNMGYEELEDFLISHLPYEKIDS